MKPYKYEHAQPRERIQLAFDLVDPKTGEVTGRELTRTKQEFKDETDIKLILDRALSGGLFTKMSQPKYIDNHDLPTYQQAMQITADVKSAFRILPSQTRHDFDNDEEKFVAWIQDPSNHEEAREMGVMEPQPVEGENPPTPGNPGSTQPVPEPGTPPETPAE